ncbi:hypothetical protein HV458_09400 [Bacillus sporothermodurans]|nr:hypothetical protein [Heyndrickxia sporothermodurans]
MKLGRQREGMNPKMRKEKEFWSSKRGNEAEDGQRKGNLVGDFLLLQKLGVLLKNIIRVFKHYPLIIIRHYST